MRGAPVRTSPGEPSSTDGAKIVTTPLSTSAWQEP